VADSATWAVVCWVVVAERWLRQVLEPLVVQSEVRNSAVPQVRRLAVLPVTQRVKRFVLMMTMMISVTTVGSRKTPGVGSGKD
jgi:hypothetical protein